MNCDDTNSLKGQKIEESKIRELKEQWECAPTDTERLKKRNEVVKKKLQRAKEMVMTANPFFGSLLYQMPYEIWDRSEWHDNAVCTAFTDGRKIVFNPMFVLAISEFELPVILCHEIIHPALQHIGRIAGREHFVWNMACDYAINLIIYEFLVDQNRTADIAMKWRLPHGVLISEEYRGMSAEQIYGKLLKEQQENEKSNNGKITIGGNSCNSQNGGANSKRNVSQNEMWDDIRAGLTEMVRGKDLTPEDEQELMSRWREALIHATACAKSIGNCPSGIESLIDEIYKPVVDWRTVVQQFISVVSKDDYTWARPNSRLIGQGIYTPSLYSRKMGDVVAILDDSGSMYNYISYCVSEIIGLFYTAKSTCLHFITCDTEPHHVADWTNGENEPIIEGKNQVKVIGGGGTSFVKPFEMIRNQDWTPSMVLYFTDLDGEIPTKELDPQCPVLWICINDYHKQEELPFGKLCVMTEIVNKTRERM